jgi:hypothetical protein
MWNQVYNPLGNTVLSTIAAALPVVTLLVLIATNKVKAHIGLSMDRRVARSPCANSAPELCVDGGAALDLLGVSRRLSTRVAPDNSQIWLLRIALGRVLLRWIDARGDEMKQSNCLNRQLFSILL